MMGKSVHLMRGDLTGGIISRSNSELVANRVMKSVTKLLEQKLGQKMSVIKSKIGRPKDIKYLGFGYYYDRTAQNSWRKPKSLSGEAGA